MRRDLRPSEPLTNLAIPSHGDRLPLRADWRSRRSKRAALARRSLRPVGRRLRRLPPHRLGPHRLGPLRPGHLRLCPHRLCPVRLCPFVQHRFRAESALDPDLTVIPLLDRVPRFLIGRSRPYRRSVSVGGQANNADRGGNSGQLGFCEHCGSRKASRAHHLKPGPPDALIAGAIAVIAGDASDHQAWLRPAEAAPGRSHRNLSPRPCNADPHATASRWHAARPRPPRQQLAAAHAARRSSNPWAASQLRPSSA